MIRTQIYLTETQRERVERMAKVEGVPMAEVVRRALDAYLSGRVDAPATLRSSFGADPDASVPSRDEWGRG